MRELKREEYGMISGGIDTTNLHAVFVDAPPSPSSGGFILVSSGNGLTRGQANEACGLIGGVAKLAKKSAASKFINVKNLCKTGVNATINAADAMPKAICTQVDGGTWDAAHRTCIQ